ncbi:MAG TPA: hypothetical protein PLE74_07435 [Candidatus Cloacimonadota bacterium]|nr:hypothetical protein [Candidatus Cloacimonadota bacterium]HPT72099.1 hypothetical protein [Candidatus Cloacimonadota bacterium]
MQRGFINVPIFRNFSYFLPHVYRYMNKEFVDLFFETGKIKLSCFNNYRKYENQVIGDSEEGYNSVTKNCKDEDKSIGIFTLVGLDAYSLCTSTILSKTLMDKFNYDAVMKIHDPQAFSIMLASCIVNFKEASQGHCIYVDNKMNLQEVDHLSFTRHDDSPENQALIMEKLKKIQSDNPNELYFLKPMRYNYQSEYRFVWLIDGKVKESIEIECKQAVQFCERVTNIPE